MSIYGQPPWKSRRPNLQDSPLLRAEVDAIHGLDRSTGWDFGGAMLYAYGSCKWLWGISTINHKIQSLFSETERYPTKGGPILYNC